MLAALPPIAGSTPITRPMNVDQSSRNGRDRISHSTFAWRHGEVDICRSFSAAPTDRVDALQLAHDLREGEHADQHRQERHAAFEPADAEREARLAHHRVVAEHRHHAADRAGEQALDQRALHQAGDHRQREHEEREVLPGAELERELRRADRWRRPAPPRRAARRRSRPRCRATAPCPARPCAPSGSRRRWSPPPRACPGMPSRHEVIRPPVSPPT